MMAINTRTKSWASFAVAALLSFGATAAPSQSPASIPNPAISNSDPDDPVKIDETQALATSQAAIGRIIGDYSFRDTNGTRVRLSDFRGKPLVISMIYSSCADVCPVITQTLEAVDEIARDALGDDAYTIITIGFDVADDNPVRMKSFARQNGVPLSDHWLFLSSDLPSILGFSEEIGFQFFESVKGFDHLTQTTILDADGVVYRQIYGETFQTPHFVEPLKNLVFGTATPFASLNDLISKVRLFCTVYDPTSDEYRFEYAIFFRMIVGAVIILSMMTFIGKWLWQNRRAARKNTLPKKGQKNVTQKNITKGQSC